MKSKTKVSDWFLYYAVVITRYTPPERGLVKSIDSMKRYRTENGARQHCLNNFNHIGFNLFKRDEPNGDQLVAEVQLRYLSA